MIKDTTREAIATRLLVLSEITEKRGLIGNAIWATREAAETMGYIGPAADE